jgi:hypothetical protein
VAFQAGKDLEIYRGNFGAPQPGGPQGPQQPTKTWQHLMGQGVPGPETPSPVAPQQMVQQMAESQPEASVGALAGVAGGPMESPDVGFTGAGPGQMRPGLSTRKPAPDDGGLRALQRRVY